jgi:hypothetical protein
MQCFDALGADEPPVLVVAVALVCLQTVAAAELADTGNPSGLTVLLYTARRRFART